MCMYTYEPLPHIYHASCASLLERKALSFERISMFFSGDRPLYQCSPVKKIFFFGAQSPYCDGEYSENEKTLLYRREILL